MNWIGGARARVQQLHGDPFVPRRRGRQYQQPLPGNNMTIIAFCSSLAKIRQNCIFSFEVLIIIFRHFRQFYLWYRTTSPESLSMLRCLLGSTVWTCWEKVWRWHPPQNCPTFRHGQTTISQWRCPLPSTFSSDGNYQDEAQTVIGINHS